MFNRSPLAGMNFFANGFGGITPPYQNATPMTNNQVIPNNAGQPAPQGQAYSHPTAPSSNFYGGLGPGPASVQNMTPSSFQGQNLPQGGSPYNIPQGLQGPSMGRVMPQGQQPAQQPAQQPMGSPSSTSAYNPNQGAPLWSGMPAAGANPYAGHNLRPATNNQIMGGPHTYTNQPQPYQGGLSLGGPQPLNQALSSIGFNNPGLVNSFRTMFRGRFNG